MDCFAPLAMTIQWSEPMTSGASAQNHLYYGDNLTVLRDSIADELSLIHI